MKGYEIAPADPVNHLADRRALGHNDPDGPCASRTNSGGSEGAGGLLIDLVDGEGGEERPDFVIEPPDVGYDVRHPVRANSGRHAAEAVAGAKAVAHQARAHRTGVAVKPH